MKYAAIQALEGKFAVGLMCRCLGVSRGGYYQWKRRPASLRRQARQALEAEVLRVFDDEKGRIARRPRAEGRKTSRNTVASVMKAKGLRAKAAKKFKATTNSNHGLPAAPNLLGQDFEAAAPDQKRNGGRTSPVSGRAKDGCAWPWCSTCSPAGWSAGPWWRG